VSNIGKSFLWRILWLASLILSNLAPTATAQATYTYTGQPYQVCTGSYEPICSQLSVTGSFTVPQALDPNLVNYPFGPSEFSFTDGGDVSLGSGQNLGIQTFQASTDQNGNLNAWTIQLEVINTTNYCINYNEFLETYGWPGGDQGADGSCYFNPQSWGDGQQPTPAWGSWQCSGDCEPTPTREKTSFDRWGAIQGEWATAGLWNATLSVEAGNFDNYVVREEDGNQDVDPGADECLRDTCWFKGSKFSCFDKVTGGQWTVSQGNPHPVGDDEYGQDFVGWSTHAVNYYRSKGRAPCGTEFKQIMEIQDPNTGDWNAYGGKDSGDPNTLGAKIDKDTVSSTRARQTRTEQYK
jgi:hypothetical protein